MMIFSSVVYNPHLGPRFRTDVITEGEESMQICLYYQKKNSKSMVAKRTIKVKVNVLIISICR